METKQDLISYLKQFDVETDEDIRKKSSEIEGQIEEIFTNVAEVMNSEVFNRYPLENMKYEYYQQAYQELIKAKENKNAVKFLQALNSLRAYLIWE